MRLAFSCLAVLWLSVSAITLPESYNVVWTSQSNRSADSMPLGGGGLGVNVWVENNDILLYVAKEGTFDDNNSLVKLGRIRLTLDPNPFESQFKQTLNLNDGYITIAGQNQTALDLWVDINNAALHIELSSPVKRVKVKAAYESWRWTNRLMAYGEWQQSDWNQVEDITPTPLTRADNISFEEHGVRMFHQNQPNTTLDVVAADQQFEMHKENMFNPLAYNTYGLYMYSPKLIPGPITSGHYMNTSFKAWNLQSEETSNLSLTVFTFRKQTLDPREFNATFEENIVNATQETHENVKSWWHNYWDRSWIIINEKKGEQDPGFTVGKNYQIFRYMQGCNWGAEWPMKWNGGLFTYDPYWVDPTNPWTPDYRSWTGGVHTAQNQRLLYWPMLKSGDVDLMKPQFEYYRRLTPVAMQRGRTYFNINASLFTEQLENYGLPSYLDYNTDVYFYNKSRPTSFPVGIEWNDWLEWLQDTANEFADMILQAGMFFDLDLDPYMLFIESQLQWFDIFYQQYHSRIDTFSTARISGSSKLVIYPGSGAETYKVAYNPASTVSGLRKVLADLLQINPNYVMGNTTYYQNYTARVPETPLRYQQGFECISPALAYVRIQNSEIPQLYPVFPWGEYGLGLPNLSRAINTYFYDTETQSFHDNTGWKQDVIWMARMGLTKEATNLTISRWADSTVSRFPVFKGPHHDWAPDMNHFGSASIALQEMLMQTFVNNNTQIRLLGAWPKEWDVDFKLSAPFQTVVKGVAKHGRLGNLTLIPSSRKADVVYGHN
ncbi:hypothetical protein EYB26_005093 [Talaromyces marneffei]|uniref:uncharacterized protein n=1 Tax=Talaromyces marneffei TaxID=37727 RepID=UPI0012A88511|nr:uncharacterized protein EYB26_005093 [Talaromyces marneffei]QGA17422.1 hypothetical protein EYB26_005093 [Talaromyces marneffei]